MTREDAYYERIKLLCGYWDSYDEWLNGFLGSENPLSAIVLDLLDCRDNMKDAERCLNLYCLEAPFDSESVYTRLRLELRDKYINATITKDDVVSALFRFSQKIPFCLFQNRCSILSDYYELAQEGIVDMKKFDKVLNKFLDEGGAINTNEMWS